MKGSSPETDGMAGMIDSLFSVEIHALFHISCMVTGHVLIPIFFTVDSKPSELHLDMKV